MTGSPIVVAVLAAAGSGSRLGAETPKQYLELDGVSLLQRSIDAVLSVPRVSAAVISLASDDFLFAGLHAARDERVSTVAGGASRALSVRAGVDAVRERWGDDAWALVHDAARPLVARQDIERLLDVVFDAVGDAVDAESGDVSDDEVGDGVSSVKWGGPESPVVGGILAIPVVDTLKRALPAAVSGPARDTLQRAGGCRVPMIDKTVSREDLWQAQTPQLFRAGELAAALASALGDVPGLVPSGVIAGGRPATTGASPIPNGQAITDEASVMERVGATCLLVEARYPNPKITRADDLAVAAALLCGG